MDRRTEEVSEEVMEMEKKPYPTREAEFRETGAEDSGGQPWEKLHWSVIKSYHNTSHINTVYHVCMSSVATDLILICILTESQIKMMEWIYKTTLEFIIQKGHFMFLIFLQLIEMKEKKLRERDGGGLDFTGGCDSATYECMVFKCQISSF